MATEVKIPAMGESISSGILAAWHVKNGDYVQKDQVLYEQMNYRGKFVLRKR